jgi:hypothetical protein
MGIHGVLEIRAKIMLGALSGGVSYRDRPIVCVWKNT